jgi:hypothetical protein
MDFRPFAVSALLGLAFGPSSAFAQGAAPAQVEQSGPLDAFARSLGQRAKPTQPADFVRETRPAELDFIPVHSKRSEPPGKLLTADELKAREHELDDLKAAHDKIGDRQHVKVVYKPLQAPNPPRKAAPAPASEPPAVKLDIPTLR